MNRIFSISPEGKITELAWKAPDGIALETVVPDGDALWLVGQKRVYRKVGDRIDRIGGDFTDLSAGAAAVSKDGSLVLVDRTSVLRLATDGKVTELARGFELPFGLAVAGDAVLVVDAKAHSVHRIVDGKVERFAGSGSEGHDDGPCADASFASPSGAAIAPDGAILIKESGRQEGAGSPIRVRRIAGGNVTTLAKILP
jgi:hypothetical protein